MRIRCLLAAAICATTFTAQSQAMPLARPAVEGEIINVAGGCGRGWHPNYWGRCVPNYYSQGYGGYHYYSSYPYRFSRYGYWR